MRLSRSRRLVFTGSALVAIGLAGRATADTTTLRHADGPPAASASAAPKPVTSKPATSRSADKPAPKQNPAQNRVTNPAGKPAPQHGPARKPARKARTRCASRCATTSAARTGPAGSRLVTGSKAVALTFDDGPDPVYTPQILKVLAEQRVHATFCLVGRNAQKHPDLVRQIVAGGHTLCNHTWNHSLKIGKQPAAAIEADLRRTNDAIRRAAPEAKIKYFRAPGGNFTPRLVGVARQFGMTSIYWKVDPRDWDHPRGESRAKHRARVVSHIDKHVRAGAIVLSHDFAEPDTIAAYRTLLPRLRRRFELIALPT